MIIAAARAVCVAFCLLVAAKVSAGERMAFIQVVKRGDSLAVLDVTVVPGRAPMLRDPAKIRPERRWDCSVHNAAGTVVWSGALADPFARTRHAVNGGPEAEDSLAVVRIPYRPGFLRADFLRPRPAGPAVSGPAPRAKVAAVPILSVELPAAEGP
ncbi:MAG TPA: hypothetical protein VJ385_17970 [Fibrobacteria bacterium]|nr:hypothetical protein [Fibrobacteria bacterium]